MLTQILPQLKMTRIHTNGPGWVTRKPGYTNVFTLPRNLTRRQAFGLYWVKAQAWHRETRLPFDKDAANVDRVHSAGRLVCVLSSLDSSPTSAMVAYSNKKRGLSGGPCLHARPRIAAYSQTSVYGIVHSTEMTVWDFVTLPSSAGGIFTSCN